MIHSVLLPNFCCHLFYINLNDPHFSVHAHFSTLALVKLSSFIAISACCFAVRKIYKVKHSDILKMIGKWLKHTSWSYLGQSSNSSSKQLLTWTHQYIHLTSPLKGRLHLSPPHSHWTYYHWKCHHGFVPWCRKWNRDLGLPCLHPKQVDTTPAQVKHALNLVPTFFHAQVRSFNNTAISCQKSQLTMEFNWHWQLIFLFLIVNPTFS